MYRQIFFLALAGAGGTLARYWLSNAAHLLLGRGFPFGTMAVNILGCFIFGILWSMAETRNFIGQEMKIIILVGFVGSFTTFSTFIFESNDLIRAGQWFFLILNSVGQCAAGLVALWMGIAMTRLI
ncbi:fluoride efflux transporter CrcB [Desulfonatronovibrio hydrogenovorans]|uniref:fluoride efflux transporter CrcB n=1 Tax=Desulfonatronovibrio hydrogenovorans TaxID=53245 RepID=UPI000490DE06|nr:fluoride efflux transporter CrcB [Desulfonatronovibrio hydrogenovorans]